MKILFISLSQRLKNSDAVIIALSYGGLFIHQLKRIKHGNGCRICLNSTLIIKYIYIIMLYNYIHIFVWFICNTILYNIIVCMRLLCLIVYICMYCGMIFLLCARLRSGGKFCLYALLWNNCARL